MERIDYRRGVPINVDAQKVGAVVFDKMIRALGENRDTIGRQNEALKTWLKISADLGRCLMEDADFKPIPGEAVPEESAARVIRTLRADAWSCGGFPEVKNLKAENAELRAIVDDDNASLGELFDFLQRSWPGFDPGEEKITEAAMRYITLLLDRLEGRAYKVYDPKKSAEVLRESQCDCGACRETCESDQPANSLDFWQI